MEKTRIPLIFLPGPLIRAYTVRLSSSTDTMAGEEISITREFPGNGGPTEVEDYLNAHYSEWAPYVGCDLAIDHGKGVWHRTIGEYFGKLKVEP